MNSEKRVGFFQMEKGLRAKKEKVLEGMVVPSAWNKVLVAQSCLTLCDPMDCSPPGSSVHGILQARTLEWVAISSARGSSNPETEPMFQAAPVPRAEALSLSRWGSPWPTIPPGIWTTSQCCLNSMMVTETREWTIRVFWTASFWTDFTSGPDISPP